MRRRSVFTALFCALVAAGCGGNPAQDVLTQTGEALSVRSGTMLLEVVLGSQDDDEADTGFRLEGPFSLDGGELPVMNMEYTRLVGPQQASVTLISTGSEAFVEVDGVAYALPPDRAAGLRREDGGGEGLGALDLAQWAKSPQLAEAPEGSTTDTVTGEVDLVAVLGDLFRLAGGLGAEGLALPEGDEAERLTSAVTASSLEVVTRREDRVLDRLAVRVDLGSTEALSQAGFPNLSGGRLSVDLTLTDPGGEVQVEAPAGAQPLDELPTPEATPTE